MSVKPFLVIAVTAFYFAIVARCPGADPLVEDV